MGAQHKRTPCARAMQRNGALCFMVAAQTQWEELVCEQRRAHSRHAGPYFNCAIVIECNAKERASKRSGPLPLCVHGRAIAVITALFVQQQSIEILGIRVAPTD